MIKSEAYLQGMRARLCELHLMQGVDTKSPYATDTTEYKHWLMGWNDARITIESVNHSLTIFNESGINIKLEIEK
jgi:ribosome modulation factor